MSSYTFEELIESVHSRPEIWQRGHPLFSNKSRKDGWVQISKELRTHEIRLRKSWKYLVDQYRKELKSNNQPKYSNPSVWAYYDKMSFMKDEITNRQVRRKIKARINSETPSNDSTHESDMPMTHDSDMPMPKDTHDPTEEKDSERGNKNQAKPIVRYSSFGASSANKDQLKNKTHVTASTSKSKVISSVRSKHGTTKADLILRRLEQLRTEMNDDDHMFFMSVLPIVKTLAPLQKLQLRGKINEWLMQMLSGEEEGADPLTNEEHHVEDDFDDNEWNEVNEDNKEGVLSEILETEDAK